MVKLEDDVEELRDEVADLKGEPRPSAARQGLVNDATARVNDATARVTGEREGGQAGGARRGRKGLFGGGGRGGLRRRWRMPWPLRQAQTEASHGTAAHRPLPPPRAQARCRRSPHR
jgi:hypothetical protein